MNKVLPVHFRRRALAVWLGAAWVALACVGGLRAEDSTVVPLKVADADASKPEEMKPYTEVVSGTSATFKMTPIPGGKFMMGSPEDEADRQDDEGPQHEVEIEPFWMGVHETTWDAYEIWSYELDIKRRQLTGEAATPLDKIADAVTRPTAPYTDMTFGMGKDGYPAICMTQLAAKKFCEWLTAKSGRYYRLPTEAEWEYACRAGTTTAYSFGDDPDELEDYGWFFDNADDKYQKVGLKKPNPWGLYDMHGNVSEWVLDGYEPDFYEQFAGKTTKNPFCVPKKVYPRVVRGGSWDDDPDRLRSAARIYSGPEWKTRDPQLPQSIWYHTDATFVGFRVIRPLRPPTPEELQLYGPDKAQLELIE